MSKNNPLLQTLVESPLPEPIDMLPQTLGWKALAVVAVIGAVYYSTVAYRKWKRNAYKRQALSQLEAIASTQATTATKAQTYNQILKKVASESFGNRRVSSLHGEVWSQFLKDTCQIEADEALLQRWQTNLYKSETEMDELDLTHLAVWTKKWISTHKADISIRSTSGLNHDNDKKVGGDE
ncbi:DUF4381 domain-containing protein [uncultured Vibrio sp.]|mgnify:CR=1 FL=1|uniref:DUF4381 domain-containing protein n=1 Tax=uncultured Vibrio sp. TaxID=114054 RepID=UPI0025F28B56|nr:DUF4381 domain-containing protein [uncultured Vibrio sp.]